MNRKEKKLLNLKMLTNRVRRNVIDRRSFIKGAVALGLTASTAMLLYQAYDHGPNGAATVFAQESGLIKRLNYDLDLDGDLYESAAPTEGKSLVLVPHFAAHPFWVLASQVFEREVEDPVVGMKYTLLDSAVDPAKEQELLDLGISRKFDVMTVGVVDPAGVGPQIRRAREAGQIFVSWPTDSIVHPTLKYGFEFYTDGWLAGQYAADTLPAGSKVYGAVGDFVVSAGLMRRQGWLDAVAARGLESLAFEEGTGWSQEGGYTLGRTVLQRFPDIMAIYGGEDQGALGFSKAATDLGRRDEMLIIGNDGLREGQEAVADGRLDASIAIKWGLEPEAVSCTDQIFCLLRGGVHGDAISMSHIFEMVTVDKNNIAEQWKSPV